MKKIIVGLGEILWDVFPTGKVLGGAPANFAYHVNQSGCEGYVVSAVGEDKLGREVLKNISDRKVPHIIQKTGYPTGTIKIIVDRNGVPSYEITEDVAWDHIEFTPQMEKLAQNTSAVCFGTLAQRNEVSRKTFSRFFEAMPAESLKVYDINLRQHFYSKELIERSLRISNILKLNDEELDMVSKLFILSGNESEQCRQLMRDFSLETVVLTKGTEGSRIVTETANSLLPTPKVKVKDTVGAGDAFTAAFIASYMNGGSMETAHRYAVNIAAYVCTKKGAMPPCDYTNVNL